MANTSIYLSWDEGIIVTCSTSSHKSQSSQGVEIIVDCGRGSIPGTKRTLDDCGIIPGIVYCVEKKRKCLSFQYFGKSIVVIKTCTQSIVWTSPLHHSNTNIGTEEPQKNTHLGRWHHRHQRSASVSLALSRVCGWWRSGCHVLHRRHRNRPTSIWEKKNGKWTHGQWSQ